MRKRAVAKRILLSAIVFIVSLSLIACGGADKITDESKETAISIDSYIFKATLTSEEISNILIKGMAANGDQSLFGLYEMAKDAEETQNDIYKSLSKLDSENYKDYVDAAKLYVIYGKDAAAGVVKYIDKNEMKYLSDTKECLESLPGQATNVTATRLDYLSRQGLTDGEILEILGVNVE